MSERIRSVGFIGIGVMGGSMARHLLAAGYDLAIFARSRDKARALLSAGAEWCASPAELARRSEAVLTIVGTPSDVESLYFGPEGLLTHARSGAFLVDMTTSSPALARKIAEAGSERGLHCLDAPVTGGDVGAREARLSILVGGDAAAFSLLEPLFRTFGTTVVHQGGPGLGQHAKLANQLAIAGTMLGLCEALGYAERAGLDPAVWLRSISKGAAASAALENLAPRMLAADFAPGFFVKHLIKDLELAAAEAERDANFPTPTLRLALEQYRALAARGYADDGTQALFRLYTAR